MKSFLKKIIVYLLILEAKLVIKKYKPRIIGITGTVGKTTTKDMVAHLLGSGGLSVRGSEKSYNSEIGLPLTILGEKNAWSNLFGWGRILFNGFKLILYKKDYPKFLALEMGVDRPLDMKRFVSWIRPGVVIVTAIGSVPVHIEYFKNQEELVSEKEKLVEAASADGEVFLNFDDELSLKMRRKSKAAVTTYGFSKEADIFVSDLKVSKNGTVFKVNFNGSMVPVRMPYVFGKQYAYSALVAMATGKVFGLNLIKMSEALTEFTPPPGRMNLVKGKNKIIIFDDTYNSSPIAVVAAMEVLNSFTAKNKAIIFGDMLELGKHTAYEHKKIGRLAAEMGINIFIGVGARSKFAVEVAREAGMPDGSVFWFADSVEAGEKVLDILPQECLVVVKGSQGIRMEKVVEKIMAYPEDKSKILVRQDEEWKSR